MCLACMCETWRVTTAIVTNTSSNSCIRSRTGIVRMFPIDVHHDLAYSAELRGQIVVRDLRTTNCDVVGVMKFPAQDASHHASSIACCNSHTWVAVGRRLLSLHREGVLATITCAEKVLTLHSVESDAMPWLWARVSNTPRHALVAVLQNGTVSVYDAHTQAALFAHSGALQGQKLVQCCAVAATRRTLLVALAFQDGRSAQLKFGLEQHGRGVVCSRGPLFMNREPLASLTAIFDGQPSFIGGTMTGSVVTTRGRVTEHHHVHDDAVCRLVPFASSFALVVFTDGSVFVFDIARGIASRRVSGDPRPLRGLCAVGHDSVFMVLQDGTMRMLNVQSLEAQHDRSPSAVSPTSSTFTEELFPEEHNVPSRRSSSTSSSAPGDSSPVVHPFNIGTTSSRLPAAFPMSIVERCLALISAANTMAATEAESRQHICSEEAFHRDVAHIGFKAVCQLSLTSTDVLTAGLEVQELTTRTRVLDSLHRSLLDEFAAWRREGHFSVRWESTTNTERDQRLRIELDEQQCVVGLLVAHCQYQRRTAENITAECKLTSRELDAVTAIQNHLETELRSFRALQTDYVHLEATVAALRDERDTVVDLLKHVQGVAFQQSQDIDASSRGLAIVQEQTRRYDLRTLEDSEQLARSLLTNEALSDLANLSANFSAGQRLQLRDAAAELMKRRQQVTELTAVIEDLRELMRKNASSERTLLENVSRLQHQQTTALDEVDTLSARVAGLETELRNRTVALDGADHRVAALSEENETLRRRLTTATKLADETLAISQQQNEVVTTLHARLSQLVRAADGICAYCESQMVSGAEPEGMSEARSVLREALYDLAAARRDGRSVSPPRRTADPYGKIFDRLKLLQETCFPKTFVTVSLDRAHCVDLVHRLRSALHEAMI
jgi:hypothetical protein